MWKCKKGEKQYKVCKELNADYCSDCPHGIKENSIEEDIKNAEHFINPIKTDKEYKEGNGWHGYYDKEIVELARMLEHILSDYKRVSKENERYQESDYGTICLENNGLSEFLDRIQSEYNDLINELLKLPECKLYGLATIID